MKLKVLAIALLVAGAASAQLNPRIPLAVTPGVSPGWATGGTQIPVAGSYPLTPVPVIHALLVMPTYNSTTTQLGNFGYYNDSLGTMGTSTTVGNSVYSNYQNLNGRIRHPVHQHARRHDGLHQLLLGRTGARNAPPVNPSPRPASARL